jgi:hypothetical protein
MLLVLVNVTINPTADRIAHRFTEAFPMGRAAPASDTRS